ncbi:MAG: hypothetical protein U5N86_08885 [Planctomycetota bacterium]|nr:hypothetical protein [Planctomycetota bacterium]
MPTERHYSSKTAFLAGEWSSMADSIVSRISKTSFLDDTTKLNLLLSRSSKHHLIAVLDEYTARTAKWQLGQFENIVRSRFLYTQLLRAGRATLAKDVLRRSHAVRSLSYLPPFRS